MPTRVIKAGQIERVLTNVYIRFFNRIKKDESYPWDMIAIRKKYDAQINAATRTAITSVYNEGVQYTGHVLKTDVYLSETDILNIKQQTESSMRSFWFNIQQDASRTREQEVEVERARKDRQTESLLGTVAQIGVTAGLAVGTFSKSNQVIEEKKGEEEEEKKPIIKWVAQLDEKTCQVLPDGSPGCASLDGQEWDYDDASIPTPGRLGPNGTHPNCRCYLELIPR